MFLKSKSEILDSILKWIPNSAVRQEAFIKGNSALEGREKMIWFKITFKDNLKLLENLRNLRASMANIIGFKSYAHMLISNNRMAKSPEEVVQFLQELSQKLRPKAGKK